MLRRPFVLVLVLVLVPACSPAGPSPSTLRIATGPEGGTYLPIGRAIADALSAALEGVTATAIPTSGGPDNVRRLEAHEAELALVQNNVNPGGHGIFAIAPLYMEYLQVVVRDGAGIARPDDLRGKRLGIGATLSGTETVARALLAHFGIPEAPPGAWRNLTHIDAADALERGELDAVFVLAGLKTPVVERLLRKAGRRILSLGDPGQRGSVLEGVKVDAPYLDAVVIPERAYCAEPAAPAGTLGVRAILVARHDLPEPLIREVTRAVFESKVRLAEREVLLAGLSERFDPADVRFPLHPGAVGYFRRDDPPVILAWADTISLVISVLLLAGSGALAAHEFLKRRRKNRIDKYYKELQGFSLAIDERAALAALREAKEKLHALRRRAFDDLMAERLEANESFTIFQDYVRSELGELESLIRRCEEAARASPERPPS